MNEFDQMMSEGMDACADVFGEEQFTIGRQTFCGDVNFFDSERELMSEGGGFVGTYSATIVAQRCQFEGKFKAPIERSVDGMRVKVCGRTLRIVKVTLDSVSLTLHLENPDKTK